MKMEQTCIAAEVPSPRPALYTRKRLGKDGKQIKICKFRTMVSDSEMIPSDGAMMRARRVHLWEEYIQNRSVVLDLKRIGKMLVAVLGRF